MTPLLAQRKAQLTSTVWSRVQPMRELKQQAPEILELSAKADIIATVFSELASLKDPSVTSRKQVQQKAQTVQFLVDELNNTLASLMA